MLQTEMMTAFSTSVVSLLTTKVTCFMGKSPLAMFKLEELLKLRPSSNMAPQISKDRILATVL